MKKMFVLLMLVFMMVSGIIMGEAREASAMETHVSDEQMTAACETIETLCAYAYENNIDDYANSDGVIYKVFWRPVMGDSDAAYLTIVGVVDNQLVVAGDVMSRQDIVDTASMMTAGFEELQ